MSIAVSLEPNSLEKNKGLEKDKSFEKVVTRNMWKKKGH